MILGLFIFSVCFPLFEPPKWFWALLIPFGCILWLIPFHLIITSATINSAGQLAPINGPLFPIFGTVIGLYIIGGLVMFFINYRKAVSAEKLQMKYFLIGATTFISLVFLFDVVLPEFGIFSLNLLGPMASIILSGFAAYALVRHRLLDLRTVVARALSFFVLLLIIAAAYATIFFLIIVAGYVMGPGFGFAMGAMTLLLSAFLTAGFGPWLPYQMLGSAWTGMGAGYLGMLLSNRSTRAGMALLAVYGLIAGFAYGVLLDLWEWPALLGAASPIGWAPGLSPASLLKRFGNFYLATSAAYDAFRAAGNCLLLLLLGRAVVVALRRFRQRFLVEWTGPAKLPDDVRSPA